MEWAFYCYRSTAHAPPRKPQCVVLMGGTLYLPAADSELAQSANMHPLRVKQPLLPGHWKNAAYSS